MFLKRIILVTIIFISATFYLKAQSPDWSTTVASIFYNNCTVCHHDGGIAPFSLIDYASAVDNGILIQADVNSKKMPPWPADPNYSHFWDERVLTDEELTAINDWVNNGMPSGDLSLAPVPPIYNGGATMLNPDDTVQLPTYTIPNDSNVYRTFVIHSNYTETKYLNEIEFIPGDPSIVHHATINADTSVIPYQTDLADTLPGYATNGFGNDPSPSSEYVGGWLPGTSIFKLPPNMGFKIPPNVDFVISIHYSPGSINKVDSSKIYFKFCTVPDSTVRIVSKSKWLVPGVLVNGPLLIPKNKVLTFTEVSFPTTHKSLLGITPHSHHVCVSWEVRMVGSPGDTTNLISIPKWSFNWQYNYLFTKVIEVPGLSVMVGDATFDNTSNNPDNPNNPPKLIHEGAQSDQEMMICGFIVMEYQEGDENIILDSAYYGLPTGNATVADKLPLEIYPNPATDVLHFVSQLNTHDVNWKLTNSFGEIIRTANRRTVPKGVYIQDVDVSDLPAGMYQLSFQSNDATVTKKIIIVR
ncbi:MAG: T9SS type A sorting domain-containing protein [Chitinophagales bacterium]|nr:T9SS type A sorting domain-containing protein [Chitinophagales bacterium]